MEALLKLLVCGLAALFILPFVLTQLLFCSTRFDSDRCRLRRFLLPGTLLNLISNSASVWCITALFTQTNTPWNLLRRLVNLQCSWQDLETIAGVIGVCSVAGLLGGLILRLLFFRENSFHLTGRTRAVAFFLSSLCAFTIFFSYIIARQSHRFLYLSEVCRKTSVFIVDPLDREQLGESGDNISFVVLSNPGPLDCRIRNLSLSSSEDDLYELSFLNVTVPAYGTCRLVTDFNHGLDLKKDGGSFVYLYIEGILTDQVRLPGLYDNTSCRRSGKNGHQEIYSYLDSPSKDVATPVLSRESGFYPEEFDLTLSAPEGLTILYTLDGSDPASRGKPYSAPIHIEDRSPWENVWSIRTDLSAAFRTENPIYTVPDRPVDKCTVVRAVCIDSDGKTSETTVGSYFIGFESREGYDQVGVISLVTNPENLFDDEIGIYVLGNESQNREKTSRKPNEWWWWPANYHQRGRTWERSATVQFFGTDRNQFLSQQVGVRIKGGASSGLLPKSLNLYARTQYGGSSFFLTDFFGNGRLFKRASLFAGGNDVFLKVKDWLTARLMENQEIIPQHYRPFCLFLDGEYWGNYWLTEAFDEHLFAGVYGLNPENVVVIKNNSVKAGTSDDKDVFEEMKSFITSNNLSLPENEKILDSIVDLDNFAVYYALEMYLANHDHSFKQNCVMWRVRNTEEVPKGDMRWRCAVCDVNHPTCYGSGNDDTLSYMINKDSVFRSLMQNPGFCDLFYSKLELLAREYFTPEKTDLALSEFTQLMEKPLKLEHQRFYGNTVGLAELDSIRTFVQERQVYILNLCSGHTAANE